MWFTCEGHCDRWLGPTGSILPNVYDRFVSSGHVRQHLRRVDSDLPSHRSGTCVLCQHQQLPGGFAFSPHHFRIMAPSQLKKHIACQHRRLLTPLRAHAVGGAACSSFLPHRVCDGVSELFEGLCSGSSPCAEKRGGKDAGFCEPLWQSRREWCVAALCHYALFCRLALLFLP